MKILLFPKWFVHYLSFDESKGWEIWWKLKMSKVELKMSKIGLKLENLKLNLLEPCNIANWMWNMKLNHIISDRGSIHICDMYVCLCVFVWMCVCILVFCMQKLFQVSLWILAHQFNSRVLVSSYQGEIVGTRKLEAKDLINPSAWRSYVIDEDWWRSTWWLCLNCIKSLIDVLNVIITCYIMLVGYMK